MRTDHRRPLVAYGLVALACALVMWQPSLGTSVAGRAPVVTVLADIGVSPSGLLSRVVGRDLFNLSPAAAPEAALPDVGLDLADDFLTPSQAGVPGGSGGAPPTVALDSRLITTTRDGSQVGGTPAPGGNTGQAGDGGTSEPDTLRGDKGAVSGKGPKGKGADHPGKGPKDKGADHPGKGPKDKGADHPGRGPKDKGADHPGRGPKDKGADHPGKGPKDKGKGPKDKGSKGKGPKGRA